MPARCLLPTTRRFSQALAVPALLRRDVAERVIDLRGEVADQYVEFSASGQERQIGRVSLVGERVVGLDGPDHAPLVYVGPT